MKREISISTSMRSLARAIARLIFASLVTCFLASVVSAGTVTGTVRNGTTGKPAAGVDVILLQLQGGMQPVANTKTDSQGRFQFEHPTLGTAPMLVRAVYRGVNYHEPIPPGKSSANVDVFEPTDNPGAFAVMAHAVIIQPNGSELLIGEEFNIENKSQPPMAFYRADGSFNFSVPEGADFGQASAWGSSGMPVVQGTIDKGKNHEAIAYAFRPGESGVRLSYKLPYPGNHITLRNVSPYATQRLVVVAPPSVQISGDGLVPAGQDQGYSVYTHDALAANTAIAISVSGTAPMPSNQSGAAGGGTGGAADTGTRNPSVNSRLDASGAEAPVA
ncbi:MAG: carboxypeptidase regulatory-like domain-containing protein, partial [Candidatus Acidiferrales bacterium]